MSHCVFTYSYHTAYEDLLKYAPEHFDLLYQIGNRKRYLDEFAEALEYLHRAEKVRDDDFDLLECIAYCYRDLKDYQTSLAYYQKADNLKNNNGWILQNLGHCYTMLKNYEPALNALLTADTLTPNNQWILSQTGWVLLASGDLKRAEDFLFRGMDDYDEVVNMNIGHVHLIKQDIENATLYYSKSKKRYKNNEMFEKLMLEDLEDVLAPVYQINKNNFVILLNNILSGKPV